MSTDSEFFFKKNKDGKSREFVGKVKIILVDLPKKIYKRRRWAAAFITLSHMLTGASVMIILFYVLASKSNIFINLHIFLSTVGFQLFLPAGILSLNELNGSTISMKVEDRKYEHVFLDILGLICGISGCILIFFGTNFWDQLTIHAIVGVMACIFTLASFLTGYCMNDEGKFSKFMKSMHVLTGVLGFLLSSMCFVSGIFRPCLETWMPLNSMIKFLGLFCIVYSIIIVKKPVKTFLKF